jgi:hypothetical protein
MKMNLLLTLGTFSTACAGVVTGIFGMVHADLLPFSRVFGRTTNSIIHRFAIQNLQNGLELSESAFLVTTGGLTLGMAVSFASVYTYFRLSKML